MKPSAAVLKKAALVTAGVLVAILLFLWLALPAIVQSQAEKFVAEKTGHQFAMERPAFNPFTLTLRLGKLQLNQPDGQPLLSFDGLLVDLSAASLPRRAFVFDAIRIDGPAATLVELPGGRLNWTPFLEALKGKEAKPEEKAVLPRLDIRSFELANGRIEFADRRSEPGFAASVTPLEISLSEISTLPGEDGKFRIAARTSIGARVDLAGEAQLNPLEVSGNVELAELQLAQLAPYLKMLPAAPAGTAGLKARYRIGNGGQTLAATLEDLDVRLAGLRVPLAAGDGPVLEIGAVGLEGGKADLAARSVAIGRVSLAGGRLQATRDAQGRIDLVEAIQAIRSRQPAATEQASAPAQPWRYRVDKFELADWSVGLRDAGVQPPAELALDRLALAVDGFSEDLQQPLPVRLGFEVRSGGSFAAEGQVVPGAPSADIGFKLADLALGLAQPYLASRTTLTLADGKLSAEGRVRHDAEGPRFKGEFAVRNLLLAEGDKPMLAFKTFGSREATATARRLDLGELRLNGLDTQLIIDKDKSINWKRVLKTAAPAGAAKDGPPAAVPAEPTFTVNVDRLRFYRSELEFADHSLLLPFGTRIHNLRGSIAGLSSRPGAPGQLELDGEVDDYGLARAVGQVDLFNPTSFMDLRVVFRNVEMTRLTPYLATFAGRKIDAGKLSLDLQYKIRQRQLAAENQMVIERLTLGERIESPSAKDLPLDLAIAILQDSDGRIDLGLPVAGSLDDPEFSYGAIVWKAIGNVLAKIVTAPFRALGALFGGGEEKLEGIAFEAGAAQLTPPEREKLVRIAAALAKRPKLVLAIGGSHAATDRVAMQNLQLRRTLLTKAGQRTSEKGDPGPVSTRQPQIQEALESLYKERFGAADLAALKDGFRAANPGQLEEGVAGKMMSRLSGLLREKKTLSEGEVAQLKGADFHGVLFERLRAGEAVGDERLLALAQARGEGAVEVLKAAGVAPERLQLLPPEAARAEDLKDGEVPLRLALEPAKAN